LVIVLVGPSTAALSQSAVPCDASKDARIDKTNPGVYLTFERLGKAINPLDTRLMEPSTTSNTKQKGDDVWLRLHNNTCWTIQLRTFSMYLPKRKPDEKPVDWIERAGYLENGSEISVPFDVEEKDGRRHFSPFDSFSISRIQSGVSVIFSVVRDNLSKEHSIFVNFNYAWEVGERGFTRTNEPQHRVEYRSHDLQRDLKQ
jgi:hypothetical protein